jgi:hypothetical protein
MGEMIQDFLAATDLDVLAEAYDELQRSDDPLPDVEPIVAGLLTSWDQSQALANLLMYPLVIPPEWRLATIERALTDADHAYLRLAAVVGIQHLESADLPDAIRHRLIQTLLDLIASDSGVIAERASISVIGLLVTTDAPEIVEVLLHPSQLVRQNLTQALFRLTGPSGVAALLDEPGFVEPATQQRARQQLEDDGVDLSASMDDQRRPLILSYLPNYAEWQG